MLREQFKRTSGKIVERVKPFAVAGVFFPAANLCNFTQGANSLATKIALFNLLYSALLIGTAKSIKDLPKESRVKKFCDAVSKSVHSNASTNSPIARAFRLVGRELSNPLGMTAYCAMAVGGLLLASAASGTTAALFPGLAGIFFGIGNFFQSSTPLQIRRSQKDINPVFKAVTHPAVWYGLGYAMSGIGIGGGLTLLENPLGNRLASFLTLTGIIETAGALGLMISGKVTNQAAPFVGVAAGTTLFAATGIATGNYLGAATGLLACAGELSLAVMMQKNYNAEMMKSPQTVPPSKIETYLTAPVRKAMDCGLINRLPSAAL